MRKTQWIVTFSRAQRYYLVLDNNREYITAVEAINAINIIIKPILILLERVYLERFYRDLEDEVLMGLSDTNYANNELTFAYIQHFER
jgi:hypothetical protein